MNLKRNPAPKTMDESGKDLSPFYCAPCDVHLGVDEEAAVFAGLEVECSKCKQTMNRETVSVAVNALDADFLGEGTYAATWFHATSNPNWLEELSGMGTTPLVHIGTLPAAECIVDYRYVGEVTRDNLFIYELGLKSDTLLGSDIMLDENEWPTEVTDETRSDMGGDGVRYINRDEDTGSVSLLIDPRQLVLKSVGTYSKANRYALEWSAV